MILGAGLIIGGCSSESPPDGSGSPSTRAVRETASSTTEAASDTGAVYSGAVGGSRYLAMLDELSRSQPGGRGSVVVEDLVLGGSEVVAATTNDLLSVDVRDDGAVAWAEITGADVGIVRISSDAGSEPVVVEASDVGCPRWLPDGSLMVTVIENEASGRLALIDPDTGAVTTDLPVRLGLPVCAAPAGGQDVVFARPSGDTYGPGGAEIIRASMADGTEQVVGHIPPYCWANDIDASPDGSALAAGVHCGPEADPEQGALYVGSMNDDLEPLVSDNTADTEYQRTIQYWHPSWSADGSALAFHRYDPTTSSGLRTEIQLVTATGEPVDQRPPFLAVPALSRPATSVDQGSS